MGRRADKKKDKAQRRKRKSQSHGPPKLLGEAWIDQDGVHTLLPGTPPDQQALQRMTGVYQEQIRKSPLWDEMVREFGRQKAEELLKQCRAELR